MEKLYACFGDNVVCSLEERVQIVRGDDCSKEVYVRTVVTNGLGFGDGVYEPEHESPGSGCFSVFHVGWSFLMR